MTRNTFLASIAALFTAPFIGKSKGITIPPADEAWLNANPGLLEGKFIESQPITAEEVCRIYKMPIDALRSQWSFTMNRKRRQMVKQAYH